VESVATSKRVVRVGAFALDMQSAELSHNGETVRLPEQPFQILRLLIERRSEVITREELRQQLWPADTFVDFDRSVNSAMKKLRDALGDSADAPTYIETIPRRGYRLIAPVGEAVETKRIPWLPIAAAVAILAIVAFAVWRFRVAAAPPIRSLAVLPLTNLSGDPGQEYFSDGMTEALITDLAQLQDVRVISRTSVMRYKQTKESLPQIAKELDVDAVVEGGVVRAGSRVRVTLQLIRASNDQHIWAQSFERDFSDILTLERELSASMSHALHAELTPLPPVRRVDPAAYELFFRGRSALGRETAESVREAISDFQKAVAIQPDFAKGYASLAFAYSQLPYSGAVSPAESMGRAKAAATKAVELDPQLSDGHTELGRALYQYDWNWSASEQEFRRALELNPNDREAHLTYSVLLYLLHRNKEAEAEAERVRALAPIVARSSGGYLGRGAAYRSKGDYPRAIAELTTAVQMDPTLPRGHFQLGWTLAEAGRTSEGIAELEKAVQLSPNNARFRARLGCAYALSGNAAKAREILADLEKRSAKAFISPASMALVPAALHDNGRALDLLERAYRERDFELINLLGAKTFDALRAEPRFRELKQKIGLPKA